VLRLLADTTACFFFPDYTAALSSLIRARDSCNVEIAFIKALMPCLSMMVWQGLF
jgi:hypothetical protein